MGFDISVYSIEHPGLSGCQAETDTFGVDQFSLGTTEPLRRAISRIKRAVKSASGSSFSLTSESSLRSLSASISSISEIRLVVSLIINIARLSSTLRSRDEYSVRLEKCEEFFRERSDNPCARRQTVIFSVP